MKVKKTQKLVLEIGISLPQCICFDICFFSSMQLLNSEMREIFAKEKANSLYSFGNIWHIPTYSVADIYMVFNDISR